jgi:hypothetical protein
MRTALFECSIKEIVVSDFRSLLVLGAIIDQNVVQRIAVQH